MGLLRAYYSPARSAGCHAPHASVLLLAEAECVCAWQMVATGDKAVIVGNEGDDTVCARVLLGGVDSLHVRVDARWHGGVAHASTTHRSAHKAHCHAPHACARRHAPHAHVLLLCARS